MDILWICIWHEKLREFFAEYANNGESTLLKGILKMFYTMWSDWKCTSFMKLYNWFNTNIVNSTSHNSLLGNIATKPSVQSEDETICNAEVEGGEELDPSKLDDVDAVTVAYLNEVGLEDSSSGPGHVGLDKTELDQQVSKENYNEKRNEEADCALLTLHVREIEKAIVSED